MVGILSRKGPKPYAQPLNETKMSKVKHIHQLSTCRQRSIVLCLLSIGVLGIIETLKVIN